MKRVVVLGPGGAGKSELTTEISERTGLPVVHLDRIFWREGWTPAPTHEAGRDFRVAVAGERWILDGVRWIWAYPRTDRPRVLGLLAGLDDRVDVLHLRSKAEVQRFVEGLTR